MKLNKTSIFFAFFLPPFFTILVLYISDNGPKENFKKGEYYLYNYPNRSVSYFTKVIFLDPKNAPAYFKRGVAKSNLHDKSGLEDFNKAINLNSSNKEYFLERGVFKEFVLNDKSGALQDYIIGHDHRIYDFWNGIGKKRFRKNDYSGAIEAYNFSIDTLGHKSGCNYMDRSEAKRNIGDLKGAISDLDSGIYYNGEYHLKELYFQRAILLLEISNIQKAKENFLKVTEIKNNEIDYRLIEFDSKMTYYSFIQLGNLCKEKV
jgi:tetratricopeptide (TPR) repeat protein